MREQDKERDNRLGSLDKRFCQIDGSVNAASDCLAVPVACAFDNHHYSVQDEFASFELLETKRKKKEKPVK